MCLLALVEQPTHPHRSCRSVTRFILGGGCERDGLRATFCNIIGEDDHNDGHASSNSFGPQGLAERLRQAATLPLSRHSAAPRVPGNRGSHHDHTLLPLLRGGRPHTVDAALLSHVVPVLPLPVGGVECDWRILRLGRWTLGQIRSGAI